MKNKIFLILILIFCLSFDVNSKEAKIDSVKCRLYALQTFKTETETASIQVEFKDSLPFMSLTCSKEIEEFKKNYSMLDKPFAFKLDNGMLTRYDEGRIKYTKPLNSISEIGSINRTPIHGFYYFYVSFIESYRVKNSEGRFKAIFFTEDEAKNARNSLISEYSKIITKEE